ncbi:MAG: DUF4147 domain-containing protein, partial [Bdellovibrionales bacterium]|nr:DUF4147 domain-containing protein [Bdellovibrionales bacterium]
GVISGGTSALIESPSFGLTLDDLKQTTQLLMECGATINEINCVRKHLSEIKGGRLAQVISPASSLNFIISDVVGDDLSVIGSGPTVPDHSTFADAWKLIEKYQIDDKLPTNVVKHIKEAIDETPKTLTQTKNILVGTNRQALIAAKNQARELGYETIIVSDQIQGEASLVASRLFDLARSPEIEKLNKPLCLLAGGETTVTIRGTGKGGRNQEMALAYLCRLQEEKIRAHKQVFLSASTDGIDGPTDSAGALASLKILERAHSLKLNPEDFLAQNDSYHFFEAVDAHIKTGTTETNVCDLQVLLIDR